MSKSKSRPPKSLLKKILLAVDGSESSASAARVAIGLAKQHKSTLMILHVLYTPTYWINYSQAGMPPVYLTESRDYEAKEAKELLQKFGKMAEESGVKAKSEIVANIPSVVQAITDHAAREKVDLIVVGTRGLSGFKKLLIGSVSSGVVTHAPCSVLVVR